ncbi:neurogenic locus Notch protein, partial [Biomphalaria pfeifferi]
LDECSSNQTKCDQICENMVGSYKCSCRPGYIVSNIDSFKCQEILDYNTSVTFDIDVAKRNLEDRNSEDHKKLSPLCEQDINECTGTNLCRNGGTCSNAIGSYICSCVSGYEGRQCERNHDDCESSPCLNGGTCVDGIANYTCSCVSGFGGNHCENDIDECASNPCINNGTCADYVDSFTCTCKPGFSGTFCHINNNDCSN